MPAAYIEHRPKSTDKDKATSHYVIVVGGAEKHGEFSTQKAAHDKACSEGYRPVHTARVRHLQDRDTPDHWRHDPCPEEK